MSRAIIARAATLFALALLTGCEGGPEKFLKDTEGWDYRVRCSANDCRAEVLAPHEPLPRPACTAGATPGFALAGHRVVVACHACVRDHAAVTVDAERCRPLVCANDGACPPWHDGAPVKCIRGLCEVPSEPELNRVAAAGLCMTGAGPSGSEHAAQVRVRMSFVDDACQGDHCRAPAGCREP